jgi:DNA-3-methyladenine glycosylase II
LTFERQQEAATMPISKTLLSLADLEISLQNLVFVEPRFMAVWALHGTPDLRKAPTGLAGLLRIVTEQFLSLSAAAAIWSRVESHLGEVEVEAIAQASDQTLRSLGLSAAKVKSFRAIAGSSGSGHVVWSELASLDDQQVMKVLTGLHGVGPWTAEIYLLSNMGRADVFPAGDLALQVAVADLFGLKTRPNAKELRQLAENWQPHRAAAARLLWAHYRHIRQIPQV